MVTIDVRTQRIDDMISQMSVLQSTVSQLTTTIDDLGSGQHSLTTKFNNLEARYNSMEAQLSSIKSPPGKSSVMESVNARLDKMEHKQCDRELIVFGLPSVHKENRITTIKYIASSLGTSFADSEIVGSFRIHGRELASDPLIIKFTNQARRDRVVIYCSSSPWMDSFRDLFFVVEFKCLHL